MHGQETINPKKGPETLLHDDGDPGLEWREWAVSSYRLAGVDNVVQPKQSRLYWIGGPFHTGLETQKGQFAESVLRGVVNLLDEYRNACQQQYIAFNGVCNGRNLAYERFKSSVDPASMDNTISVGTAFPDSGQSPGASTIASISIREFLSWTLRILSGISEGICNTMVQSGGEFLYTELAVEVKNPPTPTTSGYAQR